MFLPFVLFFFPGGATFAGGKDASIVRENS